MTPFMLQALEQHLSIDIDVHGPMDADQRLSSPLQSVRGQR